MPSNKSLKVRTKQAFTDDKCQHLLSSFSIKCFIGFYLRTCRYAMLNLLRIDKQVFILIYPPANYITSGCTLQMKQSI